MSEEENGLFGNAGEIYFAPVEGESGLDLTLEESIRLKFVGLVEDRFEQAERAREHDEKRWLQAYHNFRGLYPKNVRFRESEKSRVFIKVTKTKVIAAFGQLVDVIFGTGQFPIGVKETRVPEGVPTYSHLDNSPGIENTPPEQKEEAPEEVVNPFDVGYEGDGKVLKAGATFSSGESALENAIEEAGATFKDGYNPDPQALQIAPAKDAARLMQSLIHDQIEESNGSSELRNALFEAALFGTGVVKGPFNYNKTLSKWEKDEDTGERTYNPLTVRVPRIEFVSIWDFFPDPNAIVIVQ